MSTRDFDSMEEKEVLALAKSGDSNATEYLLNKYKNFVKAKSKTYFLIGAEKSDIVQEGMIGLYKAIKDYDPEGGSGFRSFADLCITRQIITAIKSATRQKHMPLNSYISLNKSTDDEGENALLESILETHHPDPEEIMLSRERLVIIEKQLRDCLSKYETEVLKGYISGKSYTEISKDLKKTEKSIDNALQRIKKKLEKVKMPGGDEF